LGHPSKFQQLSRLGSVAARYSSSGRQPNFAVLNRGRHLYSAWRPSPWASAHILVSSIFFSFLAYSEPSHIGCLAYFHTRCGLSANLGCRSETCCTRLAANIQHAKNSPKVRHLGTIVQLCRAISLHLRHVWTIRKKLVKQQYLLHMFPQYGELRKTSG